MLWRVEGNLTCRPSRILLAANADSLPVLRCVISIQSYAALVSCLQCTVFRVMKFLMILCAFHLCQSSEARKSITLLKRELINAVALPQSTANRLMVEEIIQDLQVCAKASRKTYLRKLEAGSYRTIWTSVSADSLIGQLLRQTPSCIVGGISWQIINKELTTAENLVYWKAIKIRMVGKADIVPFASSEEVGYDLTIKGLEFRYGANDDVPEANFKTYKSSSDAFKRVTVLSLGDDEVLR